MRTMRYGILFPLMLLLAACMPAQAQGGNPAGSSLAGTSWQLTELNGQLVTGTVPLTLVFDATEPRVSGNGGCNQFSGPYTQNGASLRFGPLVSTRRACVDPAGNAQETAYFQALESTTRYALEGGQLVLYRGNQVVARFQPAAA